MSRILVVVSFLLMALFRRVHAEGARRLEGVVNINTASSEELRLLPGVGPAKIKNVLAYRRARAFRTVEEFARVKGIGRKMVRKLRLHLAVSGPTTAQQVFRPLGPPDAVSGAAPPATPPAKSAPPAAPQRPVVRPVGPPLPGARLPRVPLPGIAYPEADANHCLRPR